VFEGQGLFRAGANPKEETNCNLSPDPRVLGAVEWSEKLIFHIHSERIC
jgi:hypothetical protein